MNIAEKTALSLAPLKFATINDDAPTFAMVMPYYASILTDTSTSIPKEVQEILGVTFSEIRDLALQKMGEAT